MHYQDFVLHLGRAPGGGFVARVLRSPAGEAEAPFVNPVSPAELDGLWQAAHATRHDVAARLAVVPMVLEARGLDVTPTTIERLRAGGDATSARILERILDDEIRHVRFGTSHFMGLCAKRNEEPESLWKSLVRGYFQRLGSGPFNDSAREAAGLPRSYYDALAL